MLFGNRIKHNVHLSLSKIYSLLLKIQDYLSLLLEIMFKRVWSWTNTGVKLNQWAYKCSNNVCGWEELQWLFINTSVMRHASRVKLCSACERSLIPDSTPNNSPIRTSLKKAPACLVFVAAAIFGFTTGLVYFRFWSFACFYHISIVIFDFFLIYFIFSLYNSCFPTVIFLCVSDLLWILKNGNWSWKQRKNFILQGN